MVTDPPGSEYLRISDAARLLGVTQRWIYRRIASGDLPASKIGGLYFIQQADIQNALEQNRIKPAGDLTAAGLRNEAAMVYQKCGYCFRVIDSDLQIGGICEQEGCTELICSRCLEEKVQFCARHTPSREQLWEKAQESFRQKRIPVLLKAKYARLLELNFINRIQDRLGRFSTLIHPVTGAVVDVPDWESMTERGDERGEVMRKLGKVALESSELVAIPLNAWLRCRLSPRKQKGPQFEILVRVLSRVETMVRDGFDTLPHNIDDLLNWLQHKAESSSSEPFQIVLLASTTGWDTGARQVLQGSSDTGLKGMAFIPRTSLVYLYDLNSGELIYNKMDERVRRYAELFSPALASEELNETMQAVENELISYESFSLETACQSLPYPQARIRQAFEELGRTDKFSLVQVPPLGLVLRRGKDFV